MNQSYDILQRELKNRNQCLWGETAMLNRIILIGRLAQDPEMKYTNSGRAVATFSLAVDRPFTPKGKEKETDFIRIVVWEKQAELVAQYLHKGRLAAIEGRLQMRQYEDKENRKVRIAEVVADNVRFLDKAGDSEHSSSSSTGYSGVQGGRPAEQEKSAGFPRYNDDPFADDGHTIDIADDDLPF